MENVFEIKRSGRLIIESMAYGWTRLDELERKFMGKDAEGKDAFFGLGITPVVYSLCQDGFIYLVEIEGVKLLALTHKGEIVADALGFVIERKKRKMQKENITLCKTEVIAVLERLGGKSNWVFHADLWRELCDFPDDVIDDALTQLENEGRLERINLLDHRSSEFYTLNPDLLYRR